ncbi:hypothetical protein [Salinispira pacifica]|uniref:hypothetical protein n=1 Tax=Salinispira pacifica TaxID=1307761 RepID=UPI0006A710F9|nr:hypothetical protein [Salinispira pacifica]
MKNSSRRLIFLLADGRNLPFIIHPFSEGSRIGSIPDDAAIEGRYGSDPEVEAMALVRNTLYGEVDREVREWMAEHRFIPRFLLSLGVFFVVFFMLSFAIRDMIPLVDELLVASAAAVTTYLVMDRKGQLSKPALERKILLKKKVDRINFSQSVHLVKLERIFQQISGAGESGAAIPEDLFGQLRRDLAADEAEQGAVDELRILQQQLGDMLKPRKKKRIDKAIERSVRNRADGHSNSAVSPAIYSSRDEQLYALIRLLRSDLPLSDSVQSP